MRLLIDLETLEAVITWRVTIGHFRAEWHARRRAGAQFWCEPCFQELMR